MCRHVRTPLIFLLLAFGPNLIAQYAGYKPADQNNDFREKFIAGSKAIQSITSSFIQEKHLSLLEETILSSGHFWYKRESKVRLEYIQPYRYLLVMNGDQMIMRDESKETRVNTKSNKLFQQINHIILDCVQGTILENQSFSKRLFQNEKTELLELTPLTASLKEFFQTIIVVVERTDFSVSSIDLREPGGDHTLLRFSQKEFNKKLEDALFTR